MPLLMNIQCGLPADIWGAHIMPGFVSLFSLLPLAMLGSLSDGDQGPVPGSFFLLHSLETHPGRKLALLQNE